MKRHWLALGSVFIAIAALTGCARGSNDYMDRAGKEFELHVKKAYVQLTGLHVDADKYFFDFEEDDPNLGFREWGTEY